MKITIITLFPQMIQCFLSESIIKRAQEKGTVEIEIVNLRDFAEDSYGSVDDRPYGGGAGMVLRVDVVNVLYRHCEDPDVRRGTKQSLYIQKMKALRLPRFIRHLADHRSQ